MSVRSVRDTFLRFFFLFFLKHIRTFLKNVSPIPLYVINKRSLKLERKVCGLILLDEGNKGRIYRALHASSTINRRNGRSPQQKRPALKHLDKRASIKSSFNNFTTIIAFIR